MAKVSVTLEFDSVEAAIAALGKQMVGAPAAKSSLSSVANQGAIPAGAEAATSAPTSRSRKPRNDAGKPRGPYKGESPVQEPAAPAVEERTDKADTLAPDAAASKTPASATPAEGDKPQPSGAKSPMAGVPVTLEDCRASLEKLFDAKGIVAAQDVLSRFGVKRAGDMKPEQYADFIQYVNEQIGAK